MSKVVSGRVPDELAEWLDGYARERGVSRAAVLTSALESVRVGGVLDAVPLVAGDGKVSRPVVPAVPGVVLGSQVLATPRCSSCGGRRFPQGGFQHKQSCPEYHRV